MELVLARVIRRFVVDIRTLAKEVLVCITDLFNYTVARLHDSVPLSVWLPLYISGSLQLILDYTVFYQRLDTLKLPGYWFLSLHLFILWNCLMMIMLMWQSCYSEQVLMETSNSGPFHILLKRVNSSSNISLDIPASYAVLFTAISLTSADRALGLRPYTTCLDGG